MYERGGDMLWATASGTHGQPPAWWVRMTNRNALGSERGPDPLGCVQCTLQLRQMVDSTARPPSKTNQICYA